MYRGMYVCMYERRGSWSVLYCIVVPELMYLCMDVYFYGEGTVLYCIYDGSGLGLIFVNW